MQFCTFFTNIGETQAIRVNYIKGTYFVDIVWQLFSYWFVLWLIKWKDANGDWIRTNTTWSQSKDTHAYATRNNIVMNWKFSFVRLCLHIIQNNTQTHAFTPCQTRKQKSPLNHEHHFTENYWTQFNGVAFFSRSLLTVFLFGGIYVCYCCAGERVFLRVTRMLSASWYRWNCFGLTFFRCCCTLILPFLFAVWVLSVCRFTYVQLCTTATFIFAAFVTPWSRWRLWMTNKNANTHNFAIILAARVCQANHFWWYDFCG